MNIPSTQIIDHAETAPAFHAYSDFARIGEELRHDANSRHLGNPLNGPHGAGHTVLGASRQAVFLKQLQLFGNVRLACRSARVSAQTAYRVRRRSPGFARAWDAALVAARAHGEAVLADRAVNGWEEPVYYHGEEIARRKRFSDRLLLAHLARLDKMEEREELSAMIPLLDDVIEALEAGQGIEEALKECAGAECAEGAGISPMDRVPPVPSCREKPRADASDRAEDTKEEEGGDDLPELERRLQAMEAARPATATPLRQFERPDDAEMLQLFAFENGAEQWWEIGELADLPEALIERIGPDWG